MRQTQIRVLVVDDHPATREGLAALLTATPEFVVAASAPSGEEALPLLGDNQIDMAIVDQRLPGIDGAETARRIRAILPNTRIVLVSMFDPPESARAAADAFLFKSEVRQKLIPVLKSLLPDPYRSQ